MTPAVPDVKELADILPAGEWADIRTIPEEENGLVADRDWGLLGRARSLRAQGRAVFLKWFRPAPAGASDTTARYTGATRLERIEARVGALTRSDAKPYLVEVFELTRPANGLLIVMAEVIPLSKLIDGGAAVEGRGGELAVAVLRDLDPARFSGGWMHFDICPRNIGVKPNGACVLIDLESAYVSTEGAFQVRTPAWKGFRLPPLMNEALASQVDAAKINSATALRKMQQEVLLSAAECVFGWFTSASGVATREDLAAWISAAPADARVATFLKAQIFDAFFSDAPITLTATLEGLKAVLVEVAGGAVAKSAADSAKAPEPVLPVEVVPARPQAPEAKRPPQEGGPAGDPWEREWAGIVPYAKRLRGDRLGRAGLDGYYARLDALRAEFPARREVYDEMLLISITYKRSPNLAGAVVEAALKQFPRDATFSRWKRIIDAWRLDRSDE